MTGAGAAVQSFMPRLSGGFSLNLSSSTTGI
jgi:hypothetical protein